MELYTDVGKLAVGAAKAQLRWNQGKLMGGDKSCKPWSSRLTAELRQQRAQYYRAHGAKKKMRSSVPIIGSAPKLRIS
jgi:hypothetical protein